MTANGVVGFASDQEELSVGGSGFGSSVVYFIERKSLREPQVHKRNQHSFVPALQFLLRRKRNERCIFFGCQRNGFCNCAFEQNRVGIRKQQPRRTGLLSAERDGVIFSYPACRRSGRVYHPEMRNVFCQAVKNFRGAIGGLVVYGNDFNDLRLRGKRRDAGGDGHFFVAGGDDGGDAGGG